MTEVVVEVVEAAARVKIMFDRTARNIIAIGHDLIIIKNGLPHGEFLPWIEAEFAMSEQMARNFMNVAKAFGKSQTVGDLPPKVLYELAAPSTPPEVREEIVEMAKQGKPVTSKVVADLKRELRELKQSRHEIILDVREKTNELARSKAAQDGLEYQLNELRAKGPERIGVSHPATIPAFLALWNNSSDAERDEIRKIVTAPTLRVVK